MGNKKSKLDIKLRLDNEKVFSHIVNAYGIICDYRSKHGSPRESFENWAIRCLVDSSNAIYRFDIDTKKQQLNNQEKNDETRDVSKDVRTNDDADAGDDQKEE